MKRMWWNAVLIIAGVMASSAQPLRVPESWDKLATHADEVVKVTMDRKMLQFGSKFMDDEDDKEAKQLISKLNGIYVRSLQFKKPGAYSDADVAPIRAQLESAEWSHIVEVNNKAEKVDIYIKTVGDRTMGMVVLAQESTELTFVHLDGPITPDDLDELSGNYGIPKHVHAPKAKPSTPSPKVSK
jgi:hypothetical protein